MLPAPVLLVLVWALLLPAFAAAAPSPLGAVELDAAGSGLSPDGSALTLAFTYTNWTYNVGATALVPAGTVFGGGGGGRAFTLPADLRLSVGAPSLRDADRRGKWGGASLHLARR